MNRTGLIYLCFSGCLLIGVITVSAEDVTGKGIAEVTLEVPYPTRLSNEDPQFTVRLKNISSSTLINIPDASEAAGKQVFIKVRRGDLGFEARIQKAPREYRITSIEDGRWEEVLKYDNHTLLAPGQSVEWQGNILTMFGKFYFNQGEPQSIQAAILVGDNQWVSSNPVPIKQLPQMVNDFPLIYTHISEKNKELGIVLAKVYRGEVESKDYLFSMGRTRICEVPKGVIPKFDFNENSYTLEITFEENGAERVVLFDARVGFVISSTLTKKSIKPEPEPPVTNTPPASTKAEAVQTPMNQTVSSNVIQVASSPSVTQPEQPHYRTWWLIAGAAVLVAMIGWKVKRK
jgi:hypothetical protein